MTTGDLLIHHTVRKNAELPGGKFDFKPELRYIRPYIEHADLAICQMEAPVAPDGVKYSGYPTFAVPPELVKNVAEVGFHGCSTGNNHSMDSGYRGLVKTIDVFEANKLGFAGTARSAEELRQATWFEITGEQRNIKVALLAGTYGLNTGALPRGKPWAVQLNNPEQLVELAGRARDNGADIVLVAMHAGTEYRTEPNEEQVRVATALAKSGKVDLVIGNHAHVAQPVVKLPGGPGGEGMWTIYGHGNLLSSQDKSCCARATGAGVLFSTEFTLTAEGKVSVSAPRWMGFANDRRGANTAIPLSLLNGPKPPPTRVSRADITWLTNHLGKLYTNYEQLTPPQGDPPPDRVVKQYRK